MTRLVGYGDDIYHNLKHVDIEYDGRVIECVPVARYRECKRCYDNVYSAAMETARQEVSSIVRCKNCKHRKKNCCCEYSNLETDDNDFCSWGERRNG